MNTREAKREYQIAQWAQVFQERKVKGVTIKEFCESRGISRDMYYRWLRIVRAAACEQMAVKQPDVIESGITGFAKVCVTEPKALLGTAATDQICINYGDMQINVGSIYPPERLAVFVRELARL